MARILYAVNGDGLGHATRAHSIAGALLERGHNVRFLASLKSGAYLSAAFPGLVDETFGFCLSYDQGRMRTYRTVVENLRILSSKWNSRKSNITRAFRTFRPDLLVTDFEPLSAFFARRLGVPFVSVDNQHLLTHCSVDGPLGSRRDQLTAYLTVRLAYGGARRYFIPTFIRAPIRFQPAELVDPILRPPVYDLPREHGDFLLAYKGAGGENDAMRSTLESYGRMPVRAYGFGIEGRRGSVTFKKNAVDEFLTDLGGCAGVIASAGHSLACEALHLEKPMLMVPVAQQYEQAVNAFHIEKLGAGIGVERLSKGCIDAFVDRLDEYRAGASRLPKASLARVVGAIEREIP